MTQQLRHRKTSLLVCHPLRQELLTPFRRANMPKPMKMQWPCRVRILNVRFVVADEALKSKVLSVSDVIMKKATLRSPISSSSNSSYSMRARSSLISPGPGDWKGGDNVHRDNLDRSSLSDMCVNARKDEAPHFATFCLTYRVALYMNAGTAITWPCSCAGFWFFY